MPEQDDPREGVREDPVAEEAADAPEAPEAGADEAGETAAAEAPDAPGDEAARLAAELEERTGDLQRVTAEYANYRRRVDRDRANDRAAAKAAVAAELLILADDLDRAEEHGDLETGPLAVFAGKFRDMLAGLKVTAFAEPGEGFDPEIHEAVQDTSSGGEQVLGTVLRKGYRMDDRLLRTAMVVIADPDPAAGGDGADAAGDRG
ncbi:nucleotide exchange factor GrpE [Corynebacterium sphenisci]|uniref:nucleotide exchange factor GrpE n=1 Tax=Corynebacterium sphenisci TaxID=191493 RepID=UPI0034A06F14